jgi:RecA-family ATPase
MKYRLPQEAVDFILHGAAESTRNQQLYYTAQQLFAAGCPQKEAEGILMPPALGCGLAAPEIRTTIASAYQSTHVKDPIGGSANGPLPPADDFLGMLGAAFEPGELVAISEARENAGEWKPGSAIIKTRAEWERLHARHGIEKLKGTPGGAFISINPMKSASGRRTRDNVAVYRHVLAEWDGLPLDEQEAKLRGCGLPISTITFSGCRSIQGLVRVDAKDLGEWEVRRDIVFERLKCDPKNRDISRVARLAGVRRLVNRQWVRQRLIATQTGPKGWPEVGALPEIKSLGRLLDEPHEVPEPVIKGLLYPGCKLLIGASSKGRKSWTLLDLAVSISLGIPWLGMKVAQGPVLFINFELKEWMLVDRLRKLAADRGLSFDRIREHLDFWTLRGHSAPFERLVPKMIERINQMSRPYKMLAMDPMYKGLGENDENAAGDMNRLMNELESLCQKTEAALAITHHFAKGDPWEKEPMDRVAGSGVFGREPDALLILTAGRLANKDNDMREGVVSKEDKDCLVFADTILRASPPIPQFLLRWKRYHFTQENRKTSAFRPGSRADKFAATLKMMPRLLHHYTDPAKCQIMAWIAEACQITTEEAAKVFHTLRRGNYDILIHEGSGIWVGIDFATQNPF